jgi:hypothetical protein
MPLWQNLANALALRQMTKWLDSESGVMKSDRRKDVKIASVRKDLQVQILPTAFILPPQTYENK